MRRPVLNEDPVQKCCTVIIKGSINLFDMFSRIFFCFFFGVTGFLFVFYKMQERVYCFLPGIEVAEDYYGYFDWLFAIMSIAKFIYMLFKIYFEQCKIDVYLLDWERPRLQVHRDNPGRNKNEVNCWRSMLLCNELNELQAYRLISSEFTLIMYALLMEGFGFKYMDSYDPDFDLNATNSPRNFALFFFVTTIVIYGLGIAQYAFFQIVKPILPLKTESFVDLCSVTNISVLMFDDTYQGYYIHGVSPYGYAEISAEKLRKSLKFEASGKAQIRGISPENPNLQTFEIFMPQDLMKIYK